MVVTPEVQMALPKFPENVLLSTVSVARARIIP